MKLIVQRVASARVAVGNSITGEISRGLLVLVGIHKNDTETEMQWLARKLVRLRIFEDEEGKMNKSVADIGGGLLLVSQFTLYGEVRKGTRPSFISAAGPEKGERLYDAFVAEVRRLHHGPVGTGIFGAMMQVSLTNDGPVTLVMEKEAPSTST